MFLDKGHLLCFRFVEFIDVFCSYHSSSSNVGEVFRVKLGDKKQGTGHVGVIEQDSSSKDAAFVLVEKKKLDNMQKKNKSAKK